STFMHELGHSLNLHHGGGEDDNFKPNYMSIMSYSRQFNNSGKSVGIPGITDGSIVRTNRLLDYSRTQLDALNEDDLDESIGINGPAGQVTLFGGNGGKVYVGPSAGPINWNLNRNPDGTPKIEEGVAADVNFIKESPDDKPSP